MKKLLIVLLVLSFVIPAMATAEDRLSLSGAVRVRAWSTNNITDLGIDGVLTDPATGDDANDADNEQYWDQRFRMQAVITPADGVKGVLRMDFSETTWGTGGLEYGVRPTAGTNDQFQVDRAYIDVTKGIVNVKAGQQLIDLGNAFAYDNNSTALQVTVKTPLVIRVGMAKESERTQTVNNALGGTSTFKNDETGAEDVDQYFIDLGFKNDVVGVNVFYAMQTDGNDRTATQSTSEPNLMGAMATFGVGPVSFLAELDIFGGDTGTSGATTDYMGTQMVVQATMKMSDALTLGAHVIYSDGNNDADKAKICRFPNANFGSQYYSDFGPFNTDIASLGNGDVFDPKDTGAGAMGGGLFTIFAPMPDLTLYGAAHYLVGMEDDLALYFDSALDVNLGAEYTLVPSCTLAMQYHYVDASVGTNVAGASDPETDPMTALVARMQITF
jgi:hypothetical protein